MARTRSREIRRARLDAERRRFDHLAAPAERCASTFDLEDWLSGAEAWDEPMPWMEEPTHAGH